MCVNLTARSYLSGCIMCLRICQAFWQTQHVFFYSLVGMNLAIYRVAKFDHWGKCWGQNLSRVDRHEWDTSVCLMLMCERVCPLPFRIVMNHILNDWVLSSKHDINGLIHWKNHKNLCTFVLILGDALLEILHIFRICICSLRVPN